MSGPRNAGAAIVATNENPAMRRGFAIDCRGSYDA
jgi:hypothetical protein